MRSVKWKFALLATVLVLVGTALAPVLAQGDDDLSQYVRVPNGSFSVYLPADWIWQDNSNDPQLALFDSQVWFGDSQAAIDSRLTYNRTGMGNVVGVGGGVLVANPSRFVQTLGEAPTAASLLDILVQLGSDAGGIPDVINPATIGGYNALWTIIDSTKVNNEIALYATVDTGRGVIVIIVSGTAQRLASDTTTDLLAAIAFSVQVPAAPVPTPTAVPQTVDSTPVPDSTPVANTTTADNPSLADIFNPGTTNKVDDSEPPTDRSVFSQYIQDIGDGVTINVAFPEPWFVEDRLQNENVLVAGTTVAAIDSRMSALASDSTTVSDEGLTMRLYSLAELGLQEDALSAGALELMSAALTQFEVQGGVVIFNAELLPASGDVVIARFGGLRNDIGEAGMQALVVFPATQTAVVVVITSTNNSAFAARATAFENVLRSLRIE